MGEKDEGERRGRNVGRSSFVLSRAILMRRTCYMEWNKEVAAEGLQEGEGGIVARKRRAASRGILRRVTHARPESAFKGCKGRRRCPLLCLCILIDSCKRNESFDRREKKRER